ncbi:hypothetical protein [Saccharibacillus brassicae]|uniref:Uncharacterized protein n=1 Tax=Saccharibacillus brassicae TaxID=2583377 RepID=A0A4Y6V3M3_SACBS|nr:hypothetical protein [Saccharibacillus brassicae]QDH23458.1 hypothetical protein FFV09_22885 [Saccharibacillus brassicae]
MPNKILTTDTYHEEIRSRLGVSEGEVPDTQIDSFSVLPIAEARLIRTVPNYAELIGDDQIYLYGAAICAVAAMLAPSLSGRLKQSMKDFDFSYTKQTVDWAAMGAALQAEADGLIGLISTQTSGGLTAPTMHIAGPTRAKERWQR